VAGKDPRELFSSLYFDSLTHDPVSLRLLGERVGWDHVALGSDYPFDMAAEDPVGALENAVPDETTRHQVLTGTAESFLRPVL
jgi:aminocarboxymuconate-semialdehyde decarboxylase